MGRTQRRVEILGPGLRQIRILRVSASADKSKVSWIFRSSFSSDHNTTRFTRYVSWMSGLHSQWHPWRWFTLPFPCSISYRGPFLQPWARRLCSPFPTTARLLSAAAPRWPGDLCLSELTVAAVLQTQSFSRVLVLFRWAFFGCCMAALHSSGFSRYKLMMELEDWI